MSPCAEFNFYCDPEAAYVCMGEFQCPVTILPYEVCLKSHFSQVRHTAVQSQKTVSAYLKSKEILPFGFALHYTCSVSRMINVIFPNKLSYTRACGITRVRLAKRRWINGVIDLVFKKN